MTALRSIEPIPFPDIVPRPAAEIGPTPRFEMVRPETLHVEASYQRELSRRSIDLIRKIIATWDWSRFKPPACSLVEGGELVIIDGQHTAIAAACHPDIAEIPVLISNAETVAERANAFVGHNRDHIAITRLQMHRAAVAAGEDVAVAVEEACRLAGVTMLAVTRPRGEWKPGETIAVASITRVVKNRGRAGGAKVLRILVRARQMPVASALIDAVYLLLYEPEWLWKNDEALADVIAQRSADEWQRWAQDHRSGGTIGRTLAVEWFKRLGRT